MPARLKRGRPWTPELVRQRIKTTLITKRLQDHVIGDAPMSKTQIQAAGILLRKTLPDLTATEHTYKRPLEEMQDSELLDTLAAIRGHLAAQSTGAGMVDQTELPKTH